MSESKVSEHITSLVEKVAEEQGVADCTIVDVATNQKGEGYGGEIYTVTVKDASSDRKLDMVVKAAFTDPNVRQMMPIRPTYLNEIYFYQTVAPAYRAFGEERGVTDGADFGPKCLKVSAEENREMLVLENLRAAGFEIFDKKKLLDREHVEFIFKTYGRLHAYSFALRDQKHEEYSQLIEQFQNLYDEFIKRGFFSQIFAELTKLAQSCLVRGEDDAVIEAFDKYKDGNTLKFFHQIITEASEPSAILHGDCWSNNMMFKYERTENGKKLVDLRLIDWQIMRLGSPACDLAYCLYTGASRDVYDNVYDYLKLYHDSFSSFLKRLGSDPEKLFPFEVLKEHWKKYSKFGMITAFSIIKLKLTNTEDVVDLTEGLSQEEMLEALSKSKFDEKEYRKRVRDLLCHMHKIGAL